MLHFRRKSPLDIERKLALSLCARNLLILPEEFAVRIARLLHWHRFVAGDLPFRANWAYLEISPSSAILEEQRYAEP